MNHILSSNQTWKQMQEAIDEAIIFLFSDLRENFQNVGSQGVEIKIKIKTQK